MLDPNVKLSEFVDDFEHVRQLEYNAVRQRRRIRGGGVEDDATDAPTPSALFGVALSGGGIRSASFCLGALQALHSRDLVERIDYLSTVSGGGYTGASVISAMQQNGGRFPFASGKASDRQDNEPVANLRDNSRFLAPNGAYDLMISAAVILRGLLVNLVLVLAVVLPVATILLAANPTKAHLGHSVVRDLAIYWVPTTYLDMPLVAALTPYIWDPFLLSKSLVLVLVVFFLAWALQRAFHEAHSSLRPEHRSRGAEWGRALLLALAATFFFEVQPPILLWAIDVLEAQGSSLSPTLSDTSATRATITGMLGTIAAAIVAAAATFQTTLVGWIQKALGSPTLGSKLKALFARTLIYTAGLIVPLAIYVSFLMITIWGIRSSICDPVPLDQTMADRVCACEVYVFAPGILPITSNPALWCLAFFVGVALTSLLVSRGLARSWFDRLVAVVISMLSTLVLFALLRGISDVEIASWGFVDVVVLNAVITLVVKLLLFTLFPVELGHRWYTPFVEVITAKKRTTVVLFVWVTLLSMSSIATRDSAGSDGETWTVLWFFTACMLLTWLVGSRFTGNANGLHRLYRDRLAAAFRLERPGKVPLHLSELGNSSPYLLVNATLNARVIGDTEDQNATSDPDVKSRPDPAKRGRNADFFLFSSLFTGSASTGFCDTKEMERVEPQLDLATAVAISGAAVSSSMGRIRVGLLGPTLALLNLKLGYWLTNPRLFDPIYAFDEKKRRAAWSDRLRLYLFDETLGRLQVDSARVYVTDGGHIDNIGLYQLLKRRCKYIVVIDGEADPGMTFSAFSDLQRFARIDEGLRVTLDFTPIRDAALARMADRSKKTPHGEAAHDQHFAVGKILYQERDGETEEGLLIYVKASVTGDEPDYVLDYERRYPLFPHESTGDQFFSEEQMEAYRALGYHCVARFLNSERQDKTANAKRGKTGPISRMIEELQVAKSG